MENSPERDLSEAPKPAATPEEEGPALGEVSVRRIQLLNLAILGLTALGSLWISGAFALGVVAGGILMAANFSVIVTVIRAVIGRGEAAPMKVGLYWVKFAALMMISGALVLIFKVDGIGILVGLSTILVAIVAETLLRAVGI